MTKSSSGFTKLVRLFVAQLRQAYLAVFHSFTGYQAQISCHGQSKLEMTSTSIFENPGCLQCKSFTPSFPWWCCAPVSCSVSTPYKHPVEFRYPCMIIDSVCALFASIRVDCGDCYHMHGLHGMLEPFNESPDPPLCLCVISTSVVLCHSCLHSFISEMGDWCHLDKWFRTIGPCVFDI